MKMDELIEIVEKDLPIDNSELGKESLKTAVLFGKYLRLLMEEKASLARIEKDYNGLLHKKRIYYSGKAAPEEYKKNPFNLKVLKTDIEYFTAADEEVAKKKMQFDLQTEKVNFLNEVLKHINQRSFLIGRAIDWERFVAGG